MKLSDELDRMRQASLLAHEATLVALLGILKMLSARGQGSDREIEQLAAAVDAALDKFRSLLNER